MNKEKLSKVLTFAVVTVMGILIAIFGTKPIDIYLGIVACVAGVIVLADTIFLITRKEKLVATPFILGLILLAVGITFFTGYITFAVIVHFIIALILGTGAGLLCYGIYLIANKQTSNGVLNVVMGVVALVLAILYMAVPEFEKAFWIIVGIVIAVYGLLGLVFAIIEKKSK